MRGMVMVRHDKPRLGELLDIAPELAVIGAGVAGLIVWELVARVVAPPWIGGPLEAAALVRLAFGIHSPALAMTIHGVIGVVLFPVGYVVARRLVGARIPCWASGAAYGVALWAIAMVVVVHELAGLPAFLDWQPVAWMSLVGHVAYGMTMSSTLAWLRGAAVRTPSPAE